jgi:hypothetical protein
MSKISAKLRGMNISSSSGQQQPGAAADAAAAAAGGAAAAKGAGKVRPGGAGPAELAVCRQKRKNCILPTAAAAAAAAPVETVCRHEEAGKSVCPRQQQVQDRHIFIFLLLPTFSLHW